MYINGREYRRGNHKMDKLATYGIQDEDKIKKKTKKTYNSIYVGHHYPQTSTNNINKTRSILQTTGYKDEQNKHK